MLKTKQNPDVTAKCIHIHKWSLFGFVTIVKTLVIYQYYIVLNAVHGVLDAVLYRTQELK